jgi:hypothetical protein
MIKSRFAKNAVRTAFALGLAAAGAATAMPSYAASTPKSLSTNFTVVNLGTATANVNASYYTSSTESGGGGAAWTADAANTNFTLAANGGQNQVRQYFDNVLTANKGSVVLSADQPLGAVVQIQVRTAGTNASTGAYAGVTNPASTYYAPLVARRGSSASGTVNSQVIIQNAGTAAAATTVTFSNGFVKNLTIAANSSYYYDLDDEGGLPTNFFGSAVIAGASGAQLAVVSNLFTGPDGMQTYNAFPSSNVGNTWLVPLFTSRLGNGLSTPVTIQNLSGADMAAGSIVLTCSPDTTTGSTGTISKSNPAAVSNNGSFVINPVTDVSITGNWVGSCRITAPGNVVGFVQMRYVGGSGNPNNAASYEAINAAGTNKTAFVPLVAKRLPNGFATTVTIQNLSSTSAANVTFRYKPAPEYVAGGGSAADVVLPAFSIAAGSSVQHNHRVPGTGSGVTTHNLPDGFVGSLIVTSDQPVDGVVQLTNYLNPAGDTFQAHAVFTQP